MTPPSEVVEVEMVEVVEVVEEMVEVEAGRGAKAPAPPRERERRARKAAEEGFIIGFWGGRGGIMKLCFDYKMRTLTTVGSYDVL